MGRKMAEINIDEYEKDALLNIPDGTLQVIVNIIKDMVYVVPLHEIDIYSVSEKILELFPEERK